MHLSRAAERRSKKKGKKISKSDPSHCCESNGGHTLKFGSVAEIGYVVRSGVVFLVKCSAFAALGRMYVIRGSDYREVHMNGFPLCQYRVIEQVADLVWDDLDLFFGLVLVGHYYGYPVPKQDEGTFQI